MPARHIVKDYVEGGVYHVFNRGVEKRTIFEDEEDYKKFLSLLKEYLTPPTDYEKLVKTFTIKQKGKDGIYRQSSFKGIPRQPNNYFGQISLIAFCLMPNHFHILLKQKDKHSMNRFLQSLLTRYSMYFNKKHGRFGKLFQGAYKAVLVQNDNHLLHLSRYIHLHALTTPQVKIDSFKLQPSSYEVFLGKQEISWLQPDLVLSHFQQSAFPFKVQLNTYRSFVEKSKEESTEVLGNLILE